MRLTVVSLGLEPGDLTLGALSAMRNAARVCLRTGEHAAANILREQGIDFETLDELYLRSEDFDALQDAVPGALLALLQAHGEVVYAVADATSDATVAGLRAPLLAAGASLRLLPGVGLAGRVLPRAMELFPQMDTARLAQVSATELPQAHWPLDAPLLVLELSSQLLAGEAKLALLDAYPPEQELLFHTGLGDGERALRLPLSDLDRQEGYDHTTSILVPPQPLERRLRYDTGDLAHVMRVLRGPEGCPWDREQTHQSLRPFLLEEAYEAVDAISAEDPEKMADELGDVLLQIVFHAEIGRQQGEFTLMDVTSAICRKMISRHVHIFGDVVCENSEQVLQSWEAIKRKERGQKTAAQTMRGLSGGMPALMRAAKVQDKARRVGFDWDDPAQALTKVREETAELADEIKGSGRTEEEGGDLLFAAVNVLRLLGVDPEVALHGATEKFLSRFEAMERLILQENRQLEGMTLAEMDVYWERIKHSAAKKRKK